MRKKKNHRENRTNKNLKNGKPSPNIIVTITHQICK